MTNNQRCSVWEMETHLLSYAELRWVSFLHQPPEMRCYKPKEENPPQVKMRESRFPCRTYWKGKMYGSEVRILN